MILFGRAPCNYVEGIIFQDT